MIHPLVKSCIKAWVIGTCFGFGILTTSLIAVTINSTFSSGGKLTAVAMNELKGALVAFPNWKKGENLGDAVYKDGKVGIGINPTEKLEVNGTIKATAYIGDGSGLTKILDAFPNWLKGETSGDAVYNDGNVGIGTNPTEKLEVNGTIKATAFIGDGSGLTGILGFSKYYSTGERDFTLGSLQSHDHSLGGVPKLVNFEFVCISANNGYAIGDRIPFSTLAAANSGNRTAGYNDTSIFYAIDTVSYLSGQKTTGTPYFTPSPSNWKINVHAWR